MPAQHCSTAGCRSPVVSVLSSRDLCLTHFLDQAFDHASAAMLASEQSLPVDRQTLQCMLDDAHIAAQLITETDSMSEGGNRERILEFLLCVANLHEYAARNPAGDARVH